MFVVFSTISNEFKNMLGQLFENQRLQIRKHDFSIIDVIESQNKISKFLRCYLLKV